MVRLVYSSGRVSLLWRIPMAVAGAVSLLITCDLICDWILGKGIPIFREAQMPLGRIPALGGALLIVFGSVQMWAGERRVLVDAESQNLVIEYRGPFGWRSRKVPLESIVSVQIHAGRTMTSRFWDISALGPARKHVWLTRCYSTQDAEALGNRIVEGTTIPVIRE